MVDDYFMLQILFSFIPLIIITIFLLIKNGKNIDFKNLYFWGLVSLIMSFMLNYIIDWCMPNINFYYKYGNFFSKFIAYLIVFGFVEEFSRYLSLKFSNPKTEYEILINIIYISLIFTSYEDYSYIGVANNPFKLAIIRAFTPVHLLFALMMGYFLIKAFKAKQNNKKILRIVYEIIALIIPALIHAIYDFILKDYSINKLNFLVIILIFIISYGLTFMAILNVNKKTEEIVIVKRNKIANIFKIIIVVLFSLFYLYAFHVNF